MRTKHNTLNLWFAVGVGYNEERWTVNYYIAEVLSQNDYYPFGMLQPGRSYSVSSAYRYGYNGKENDNEVKGEGNQQDYGMRIYDPRLGRFLSVDPISKNYPELTPYQFASNRPVDGVDLDGLEYVKFVHTVDAKGNVIATAAPTIYYQMDDETLRAHGGTTKGMYNSAGYGPEGKGIKHEYYLPNGQKYQDAVWDLPGSYATHGLYSGDGSITYTGKKDYDFSWMPIDQVDAIAKRHDINYHNVGAFDVVEDSRTLSADLQMIDEATKYLNSIPFKLITGQRVAGETVVAAMSQKALMGILSDYKQWKTNYMIKKGLNPNNPGDVKKISLDKLKYRLEYIDSDKDGKMRRAANLFVLLKVKAKTNDKKEKPHGATGGW